MRANSEHDLYTPVYSDYECAPEITLPEITIATQEAREVSRRTAGRWAVKAAIAASPLLISTEAVMLDQKVSEILQSGGIEIEFVNQEAAAENPHQALITFPGFNVLNGNKIGEAASEGCKEFMQVASVTYGTGEFNMPAIIHAVETFVTKHNLQKVALLGHSMGGRVALETAGHLHDMGIEVTNIFLDCTPANRDSLRDLDDKGMFFINAINNLAIYGGMGVNYLVEVAINMIKRDKQLFDCFMSAKGKLSTANCSNRMAVQQICYMIKNDIEESLENLPLATEIDYFCPDNPANDDVVETTQSYRILAAKSRNLTRRTYLSGTAHASIAARSSTYAPHIRKTLTPPSTAYTPGGLYFKPN